MIDPTSYIGYQILHGAGRAGSGPPRPGGCGCWPLAIGAIIGLIIAFLGH